MLTNPFGDSKPFKMLAAKIHAEIKRRSRTSIRLEVAIKDKRSIPKDVPEMLIHYLLMKSAQEQVNDLAGRMERFLVEKGVDTKLFLQCVDHAYRGPRSVDDLVKDILNEFNEKPPKD